MTVVTALALPHSYTEYNHSPEYALHQHSMSSIIFLQIAHQGQTLSTSFPFLFGCKVDHEGFMGGILSYFLSRRKISTIFIFYPLWEYKWKEK